MATVMTLLNTALRLVGAALPIVGGLLEKRRGGLNVKRIEAGLKVLHEAERLIAMYSKAKEDGTLTPAEMEYLLTQMAKVVASLREAVS